MKSDSELFLDREFPTHSREYLVRDYHREDVELGWNEGFKAGASEMRKSLRCDTCSNFEHCSIYQSVNDGFNDVTDFGCIHHKQKEEKQ